MEKLLQISVYKQCLYFHAVDYFVFYYHLDKQKPWFYCSVNFFWNNQC
jgi:hypothetical protein